MEYKDLTDTEKAVYNHIVQTILMKLNDQETKRVTEALKNLFK